MTAMITGTARTAGTSLPAIARIGKLVDDKQADNQDQDQSNQAVPAHPSGYPSRGNPPRRTWFAPQLVRCQ